MTREEFLKRLHHPIDLNNNEIKVIKPTREEILKKRKEESQKEKSIEK